MRLEHEFGQIFLCGFDLFALGHAAELQDVAGLTWVSFWRFLWLEAGIESIRGI